MTIEVAVLIVSYNSRDDLAVCLPSVLGSVDPSLQIRVVMVDCASSDGSLDYVRQSFSNVEVVRLNENLGYAGGNNRGYEYIQRTYPGTKYLAILNPDIRVTSGWLTPLVEHLEANANVAIVQPKILLMDQPDRIDTAGNQSHVLGFGFVSAHGEKDDGRWDKPKEIAFASGAAMVVSMDALDESRLFHDVYFMYLEDAELSWRMRLRGLKVMYQPTGKVYHAHDPSRTPKHMYRLERNRWSLLLTVYRWRTLLLLLPMIAIAEIMVWGYALPRGLLWEKFKSYGIWFDGKAKVRRQQLQIGRMLGDRDLLTLHTPRFDATAIRNHRLRMVVNGLMALLWRLTQPLVRW